MMMFSRLLNARLKATETALEDGRLDEAYRLATSPDIAKHRRGAAVRQALGEKLYQRAREHFAAERFTEAMLDLDRAEASEYDVEKVKVLRGQIRTVAEEVRRQERSRQERIEAARHRIERGSLEAGRRLLENASADDAAAGALRRKVEDREDRAAKMLADVGRMLEHGHVADAIERFRDAKALHPHAVGAGELESRICDLVLTRAKSALESGRPRQAATDVASLAELGEQRPLRRELDEALQWVGQAGDALRAWKIDDAQKAIGRLLNLHPDVEWIQQAAADLKSVDDRMMSLQSGPLGEALGDATAPPARPPRRTKRALAETMVLPKRGTAEGPLPERLLLIVDGGGSFLLHRGERVTIGRAVSNHPADVPIFSDLAERHADVAGMDEDYFLFSPREVQVNGKKVTQALLQDGDRVVLGRKAKFTFRLPSRRSASATLDMSDGTKLPDDVRRVILFRGHAIIGYGRNAHAHCSTARQSLVLFERGGELWVRPDSHAESPDAVQPVPIGKSIEVDGVSFVLKAAGTGVSA
jgi:tetratricopeptide (TPR) repeat protein